MGIPGGENSAVTGLMAQVLGGNGRDMTCPQHRTLKSLGQSVAALSLMAVLMSLGLETM